MVEEQQDLQVAEEAAVVVEVRHLLLEAMEEELEDGSLRPGEEA